jgi:hypothetical protein
MFKKKDATTDQRLRAEIDELRRGVDKLIKDGLDYDRRMREAVSHVP